jgi:hypothetical protein
MSLPSMKATSTIDAAVIVVSVSAASNLSDTVGPIKSLRKERKTAIPIKTSEIVIIIG